MGKMIAFCGIICTDCPAYLATQKDDDEEREIVAEKWSSGKYLIKPDEINCDGCLATTDRLFKYCEECVIRKCGFEKNIKNCAYCDEFVCAKLENFWDSFKISEAKATLEKIKKDL